MVIHGGCIPYKWVKCSSNNTEGGWGSPYTDLANAKSPQISPCFVIARRPKGDACPEQSRRMAISLRLREIASLRSQ
jgi:hypothetical protein